MKLWFDDNRPAPEGWTPARNVEEAKLHLIHGDVDEASLDHDMDMPECPRCQWMCGHRDTPSGEGGCEYGCNCHEDNGNETGMDLLHWMKATGRWPKQKPQVHSANLNGRLRMLHFIGQHYPHK